jgi:hypothetical protein
MAIKSDHPEKYGWWLNELGSLDVTPNEVNLRQAISYDLLKTPVGYYH